MNKNFIYEEVTIDDDQDETNYEEVPLSDDEDNDDDNMINILNNLKKQNDNILKSNNSKNISNNNAISEVQKRPVLLDDFFRNFLIKMNLKKSLDTFQTEWYEFQSKGKISNDDLAAVPDIYLKNEVLENETKVLKEELARMKEIAEMAKSTWDKLRKERDFHRLHHRRIVQEKNQLLLDIKRLKKHYSGYEPALESLQVKYETAVKEKSLVRLERDKLAHRVEILQQQINDMKLDGTVLEQVNKTVNKEKEVDKKNKTTVKSNDTPWPSEYQENPYVGVDFEPSNVSQYMLQKTFKGHSMAISAMALHPRKPIVATVSDDMSWKMWSIPNGELIMSGDGHKDWVSDVDFHPKGSSLATASGDGTVKIWDFMNACCSATYTDHSQAVWGVSYHDSGDFIASCSMDHTAKLWDLTTSKCRQSYRGHVDSVNTICWQPFSNNLATGSGDKTVSIWDMRSGLCGQTFYGHKNAVNSVSFNIQGNMLSSVDADGVLKLWDVRMVSEQLQIVTGRQPLNSVKFDRSGTVVVAASDDGTVKLHNTANGESLGELRGHTNSVQSVVFDRQGKYLLSSGADNTFRIWS